jgi:hypothetical protein
MARIDGMDAAVVLKAAETDRRLAELNGLRAEVMTDRTQFVQKVVYDADRDRTQRDTSESLKRIAVLESLMVSSAADVERRLVLLNNLRAEVIADRVLFVPKPTFDVKVERYDTSINDLARRITVMETRSIVWTTVIGIAFAAIQLAMHFWK